MGVTTTRQINAYEVSMFNLPVEVSKISVIVIEKYNSKSNFSLKTKYLKSDKSEYFVMYGIISQIKNGIIDYYLQIENLVYAVINKIHKIQRNFDFNCNNISNLFLNKNYLSNLFLKGNGFN